MRAFQGILLIFAAVCYAVGVPIMIRALRYRTAERPRGLARFKPSVLFGGRATAEKWFLPEGHRLNRIGSLFVVLGAVAMIAFSSLRILHLL